MEFAHEPSDRRRFLTTLAAGGAAAAAVTLLPKAIDAIDDCGPTGQSPTLDETTAYDRILARNGLLDKKRFCLGNSTCADQGMSGTYPRCYYPQYLRTNIALANSTKTAALALVAAIKNRTVNQTHLNNFVYYQQQLAAHLSMQQTVINEGYRKQWFGGSIQLPPGQPEIMSYISTFAANNGLIPSEWTGIYNSSYPNLANFARYRQGDLTQAVNNLPLSLGAQDSLTNLSNNYAATVQAPSTGILTASSTAQTFMDFGTAEGTLGGMLGAYCVYGGPAFPYCEAVAGGMVAGGGAIWFIGWLMSRIR
jgi:hypothetical protein